MKNVKKFFAVVLAVVMVFATVAAASASYYPDVTEETEYKSAIEQLTALKLTEGYEDGTFKPEGTITRAEIVKMVYVLVNGTDAEGKVKAPTLFVGDSVFTDVTTEHWACGFINWAASVGIVDGIGNKLFNPDAQVKFSEVVKMLYNAAQYIATGTIDTENAPSYPYGYIAVADEMGLFDDVTVKGASNAALRGETAQLVSNTIALVATMEAGYVSNNFRHVTAVESVAFGGTTDEYVFEVCGLTEPAKNNYIKLADTWYKLGVEVDLVPGEVVTAYVENGVVVLVTTHADAKVVNTVTKSFTKAVVSGATKYYVDGVEVKFADVVTVYEQGADGLYTVSADTLADLAVAVSDQPLKLVDANGDGKYEAVYCATRNYNLTVTSVGTDTVVFGGVTVKKANVSGIADFAAAKTAGTKFSAVVKATGKGLVVVAEPMNVLTNVKVTKLDKFVDGEFTVVTIGGKNYTYSTEFYSVLGKIEKISVAETEEDKKTVNVTLDTNGDILGWEYYVAPGVAPTPAVYETGYAYVKSLVVNEIVGTWSTETQFVLTLTRLDGREVEYVLNKALAVTLNDWFCADGEACGVAHTHGKGVVLTTVSGKQVPAIVGALVEYTYGVTEKEIIALAAYAADSTDVPVVFVKAYTGLINIDGNYVATSDIAAVIYDGKVTPVADFIALLGENKSFTADVSVDNGKYTLQVDRFASDPLPVVNSDMYAVITSTQVEIGTTAGTFRYVYTGIFNGVAGTYYSVDKTAGQEIANPTGLVVANFANGLVTGFSAVPVDFDYFVFTAKYGSLMMVRDADVANKTISATEDAVDYETNARNVTVYKITTAGAKVDSTAKAFTVGTVADLVASEIDGTTVNSANVIAVRRVDVGGGKYDYTYFVLTNAANATFTIA